VQVGRVEVDVGEGGVLQRAGAKRADRLVELGADPRHLGLADPRVGAERDDEIIHAARGDSVDVGLHHHRVQRLVDASTGLEDRREERALAQLGDPQLHIAGLGRHQLSPGAVAFGDAVLAALVALGANHVSGFELDQLLQDGAN